jgi:HD-GYP domain-containing protein (c-di-GMP phosphodiesterase class II)
VSERAARSSVASADPSQEGNARPGGAGLDQAGLDSTLRTITLVLAATESPELICARIVEPIARCCGANSATILLADEGGRLRPGASSLSQSHLPDGLVAIASEATRELRPQLPQGSGRGGGRLLALPLRLDGPALGALVLSRGPGDPFFVESDVELASTLAAQVALALDRARLSVALERRASEATILHRQLQAYAVDVRTTFSAEKHRAAELARALEELEQTYLATVRGLAIAVEAKDEYTAGHLVRVTRYGLAMMRLVAPELAADPQLEYGFLLHDIGKLSVPDAILGKSGPLTDEEWELMRRHPGTGARILERIPFLAEAKEFVFAHHERWDGKGYPLGLVGEEIPLPARVFPVADAFDAMTSNRPYRPAMSPDQALDELVEGSGGQFWPDAVEAFLSIPAEDLERAAIESSDWLPIRDGLRGPVESDR